MENYEKLYKEALERARKLATDLPNGRNDRLYYVWDLESIFPELKESEDEQHRKWILEYLYDGLRKSDEQFKDHFKAAIAWIEKQGEQIPNYCHHEVDLSECSEEYRKAYYDGWNNCNQQHAQLEAEKKPADKVELKFKVGDWVRAISSGNIFKILSVNDGLYRVLCYDGVEANYPIEDVDYDLAYWTIQDAKDGDVLVTDSGRPFIFKGCLDERHPNSPVSYCGIDSTNYFYGYNGNEWWTDENVYPATEKQHDLLFQKMHEAGYEWDAEKKELKEIEQSCYHNDGLYYAIDILEKTLGKVEGYQSDDGIIEHQKAIETVNALYHKKPAEWNEEDSEWYMVVKESILERWKGTDNKDLIEIRNDALEWLKSIKDRILPQPKQEWSEEDEHILNLSLENLTELKNRFGENYGKVGDCIHWLKSIKPHWKPSEEQMDNLRAVIAFLTSNSILGRGMESLYNDLKNL